jgi:hypothetical protein
LLAVISEEMHDLSSLSKGTLSLYGITFAFFFALFFPPSDLTERDHKD